MNIRTGNAILAFLLLFLCSQRPAEAGSAIRLTEFLTKPNYLLCTDPEDSLQLTDGSVSPGYLWMNAKTVGWQGKQQVAIAARLDGLPSNKAVTGSLRLHTARGTHAGVEIPARIDIYAKQPAASDYHHAGGVALSPESFRDKSDHWIQVDVVRGQVEILIVVNARGDFVFIDEISWHSMDGKEPAASQRPATGDAKSCLLDSRERTRQSYMLALALPSETEREWRSAFKDLREIAWVVENPFDRLPSYPLANGILSSPEKIELFGSRREKESACIGLLNLAETDQTYQVSMKGDPAVIGHVKIQQVQRILAADGEYYYDPICRSYRRDRHPVPLQPGNVPLDDSRFSENACRRS
ncbi:MAG: hypothetical protein AB9866_25240 [Syntrophobacteraceae bacterium]